MTQRKYAMKMKHKLAAAKLMEQWAGGNGEFEGTVASVAHALKEELGLEREPSPSLVNSLLKATELKLTTPPMPSGGRILPMQQVWNAIHIQGDQIGVLNERIGMLEDQIAIISSLVEVRK